MRESYRNRIRGIATAALSIWVPCLILGIHFRR